MERLRTKVGQLESLLAANSSQQPGDLLMAYMSSQEAMRKDQAQVNQ